MDIKRFLTKYVVLLLVYTIIVRFIEPYGLRIYYSTIENPIGSPQTVQMIQSIMTLVSSIINLIFVIFLIIGSKAKKLLDWLIIVIAFFNPEAGITIFIVWQVYNELIK